MKQNKELQERYDSLQTKNEKLKNLVFNLMLSSYDLFEQDWVYALEYIENNKFPNLLSDSLFDCNWGTRDVFVNAYKDMISHFQNTDFIKRFMEKYEDDQELFHFMEKYGL